MHDDEDHLVGEDRPVPEEVHRAPVPIVAPRDRGRDREEENRQHDDVVAPVPGQPPAEGVHRERCTVLDRLAVEHAKRRARGRDGLIPIRVDDAGERFAETGIRIEGVHRHLVPCEPRDPDPGLGRHPVHDPDLYRRARKDGDPAIGPLLDEPQVAAREIDLGQGPVFPCAGHDDDESRHRADDDRVDEGTEKRDHPLGDRLVGLCRRMRDRGGTEPGLIREEPPPHPPERRHEEDPHAGPGDARRRVEGLGHDEGEGGEKEIEVQDDDDERARDVDGGHGRRQDPGDATDTGNPADDHRAHDERAREPRHPGGDAKLRLHHVGDRVGLDAVSRKEGAQPQADGEEDGHRLPGLPEAEFHVVHGAARYGTLPARSGIIPVPDLAVLHGRRDLGVFRRHPDEAGHPHPEEGTRPTPVESHRDARDVPDADCRGEGRRERLEVRDVPRLVRVVVAPGRDRESVAEPVDLDEPEADREVEARPDQDDHDEGDRLLSGRDPELEHQEFQRVNDPLDGRHLTVPPYVSLPPAGSPSARDRRTTVSGRLSQGGAPGGRAGAAGAARPAPEPPPARA